VIGLLARPITRRLSVGLLFVMTRKLNNDATMATVSAAFRDIWTTLENQDSLKIGTAHEELRDGRHSETHGSRGRRDNRPRGTKEEGAEDRTPSMTWRLLY
jgi:hypothetical protein